MEDKWLQASQLLAVMDICKTLLKDQQQWQINEYSSIATSSSPLFINSFKYNLNYQLEGMFEKKYLIMQTIGHNSQKMTSIVKDKANHYFIAKKVPINDEKTMHEIEMMKGLTHPNIIALHEIIQEDKWAYIIEEYCEEGDLQHFLKRQSRLKKLVQEEVIARWLLQILLAIQYLHHLKIIHRDIRPKNIFLTSNGNIKLGSFKVSKLLEEQSNYAQTLINSPYYLTPQLAEGRAYDYKVDIWAFGCVVFEICSFKSPINLSNINELFLKITKGKLDDLPYQYSKQLNMIYQKCMRRNPNERTSARELLKTAYFLDVIEKFITDKGLNINLQEKIPIKRYNIHNSKYERLKIKKKLIRDKNHDKKDNLLPKIQIQTNKIEKKKMNSKEKPQKKAMLQTPVFKRHSKTKQGQQRIEKCFSTDKKVTRTDSLKKGLKKLQKPPIMLMEERQKVSPQTNKEKQKKLMLAPPLLPKPNKNSPQLPTERRAKTKITQTGQSCQNFEVTMSKEQLGRELNIFQKKDLAEVNAGLNKIFENLKIREDDEEQVQFDFEDESELRLTSKQDEARSLLDTCKSKLEQLIEEINYKYCPDMQPIPQKTTQFDSNSFSRPLQSALREGTK